MSCYKMARFQAKGPQRAPIVTLFWKISLYRLATLTLSGLARARDYR